MSDLPKRRPGPTVRVWMASIAALAILLAAGDAIWLAPHRRELRAVARLIALGGRASMHDETPAILKRLGVTWFDLRTAGRIDLGRTKIREADFELFPDAYDGIRDIDLSGNKLRRLSFSGVTRTVLTLNLSGTGIDDAILGSLLPRKPNAGLGSLHELDLSDTDVTDEGVVRVLPRLDNLAWVNLAGTEITPDDVARLRALRPRLTITQTPGARGRFLDVPKPAPISTPYHVYEL